MSIIHGSNSKGHKKARERTIARSREGVPMPSNPCMRCRQRRDWSDESQNTYSSTVFVYKTLYSTRVTYAESTHDFPRAPASLHEELVHQGKKVVTAVPTSKIEPAPAWTIRRRVDYVGGHLQVHSPQKTRSCQWWRRLQRTLHPRSGVGRCVECFSGHAPAITVS